jgi:hypothetical protein
MNTGQMLLEQILRNILGHRDQHALLVTFFVTKLKVAILNTAKEDVRVAKITFRHCVTLGSLAAAKR